MKPHRHFDQGLDNLPRDDQRDGISQLTDLMRQAPAPEPLRTPEPVDPAMRRRRRRRRQLATGISVVVVLGLAAGYAGWALNAPIAPASLETDVPQVAVPAAAQVALSPDGAMAVSVEGADDYLGTAAIWAASGGDQARPMASISKIVTALVILSAKPLADASDEGPTITFDKDDHALYDKYYVLGATIAAMPTGTRMSERDALETMLIISASNYAEATATWAFGSQSAFLRAARDWLAANGLGGTTMVEPTGIDPRNTSTPADLIALGKIAMADPVVSQIVGMRSLSVAGGVVAGSNTNDLLGSEGIIGIKTGTLEDSGSNLLFRAVLDVGLPQAITVTGVQLGGFSHESVDADVRALLASIRGGFHPVALAEADQVVGTYTTAWGASSPLAIEQAASVVTWSDTPVTASLSADALTTGAARDEVGEITWTAGTSTVTGTLVLTQDIAPPTAWWRLTHPFELGG